MYKPNVDNHTNANAIVALRWNAKDDAVSIESSTETDNVDTSPEEERQWLDWLKEQFKRIAGEDGEIDLQEFKDALGVKKSFFAERFFNIFDTDSSGNIELSELVEGLESCLYGSKRDKLEFLFKVYDIDGSGVIDRNELKMVMASCLDESSLQLSEEDLQLITDTLFDAADEDCSGSISFIELEGQLKKYPGVMENLSISAAQWLKPPAEEKRVYCTIPRYLTLKYMQNNVRKIAFFWVFIFINLALCALSIYRYIDSNIWIIVARCCGMCLNFNCSFIFVFMLRYTLSWLRSTKLGNYLPIDQQVMFHKFVGYVIVTQSVIHAGAHLGNGITVVKSYDNLPPDSNVTTFALWEILFTLRYGLGWVGPGFAYISGDVLLVIILIMFICSMSFVRRGGYFQVFYWTHLLYVPFIVFCILHGPIFWYFFIVPGTIFVIERIMMSKFAKIANYGRVHIKEVNLLPSKVTHLVITRPRNFRYEPGDYVFINIPKITSHEWHPFTISSCPEDRDEVWVHVRSVGHWTNKLYQLFDEYLDESIECHINDAFDSLECGDNKNQNGGLKSIEERKKGKQIDRGRNKQTHVQVFIDGPFGTSTREIFESEHAVLISSGIGVTPYASILQSIVQRYKLCKRQCPSCEHGWYDETKKNEAMRLNKVDFIWMNRSQKSFEWFVSLLAKIEDEQGDSQEFQDFLNLEMYITSALKKTDMKAVGLQMAMEILHKKGNKDMITGLRARTHPGRPQWNEVFRRIADEKKGRVNVFFCGSPLIDKELKLRCQEFGFGYHKENF